MMETETNSVKRNKIYAILMMESIGMDPVTGFPDFGTERLVGYYFDKEDALKVVKENCCDLWETCYDYALVEEVVEGIYQPAMLRWFFHYNKAADQYEKIEEPKFLEHFSGFAIG